MVLALRRLATAQGESRSMSQTPLFCDRCAKELTPGEGDFYVVRIAAVADPTPPNFSEDDLARDFDEEIRRLCAQLEEFSEQELIDQVYRRLTLYLCNPCFRDWIEHPTG
jgi:hypothetical protein